MVTDSRSLASLALAAFAESWLQGRRALLVGDASSRLWEHLLQRGARMVHVCDPDPTRIAEASARGGSEFVSFAPFGSASLAVRDGVFDVALIENLAELGEPSVVLRKLRRALSGRGIALVACPNPDALDSLAQRPPLPNHELDYYTLYDLVHREFALVRMVGQMPFVAYSVAELAPLTDPEPCIDTGFISSGTEEPEWFVAIASTHELPAMDFSIVQLPLALLDHGQAERTLREQLRTARLAERAAVEQLARLTTDQADLRAQLRTSQPDVDLAKRVRLLEEELDRKEAWIGQLEARAATADARADAVEQELDELRQAATLCSNPTPDSGQLAELRLVETERDALKLEVAGLKEIVESSRAQLEALSKLEEETEIDFTRLENQLADRAGEIRHLREQLDQTERLGRRLVNELGESRRNAEQVLGERAGTTRADAWAVTASFEPAASTEQSPAQDEQWTELPPVARALPGQCATALTCQLAESRANLRVAEWRIRQLEAELAKKPERSSEPGADVQSDSLLSALQTKTVLLHQLQASRPSKEPMR